MKRNLKIISLLLVTVLTLGLFGCSGEEPDREYDEAEVLSAAGRLIKLSETLNRIYYGEGIGYTDGEGAVGAYKPADTAELKRLGFSTVEELKAKTRVVFSKKMSETMFNTVLSAVSDDDDTIIQYARYYQESDKQGNPIRIMVLSSYDYFLKNGIEYGENITVLDVEGQIIKIGVPVTLTREDGKVKTKTLTVDMIEEEDGWRLASPTYSIYNESTDKYEDLLDQLG